MLRYTQSQLAKGKDKINLFTFYSGVSITIMYISIYIKYTELKERKLAEKYYFKAFN